jgi:integrase/recombinase XerD
VEARDRDESLKAGVPIEVIALWMGHEQLTTTHGYIEADLTMKKECLENLRRPAHQSSRRSHTSHLLTFLEAL